MTSVCFHDWQAVSRVSPLQSHIYIYIYFRIIRFNAMIFRYSGLKCLYLITENKCTVVALSGYLPHYLNIKVLEILAEENNTTQGDKGYIN